MTNNQLTPTQRSLLAHMLREGEVRLYIHGQTLKPYRNGMACPKMTFDSLKKRGFIRAAGNVTYSIATVGVYRITVEGTQTLNNRQGD